MFKHAKCYRINIPTWTLEIGKPPSGKPQRTHTYLKNRTPKTKLKRPLINTRSYHMGVANKTANILSECGIDQWKKTK